MADAVGNVLRAPGTWNKPATTDIELLYSYSPPPLIKGGTVKPGQGVLAVGQPMVFETATKQWKKGAADLSDAEALLKTAVDSGAVDDLPHQCNLVFSGQAKLDVVLGALGVSSLPAIPDTGIFAGATIDTNYGFIKF